MKRFMVPLFAALLATSAFAVEPNELETAGSAQSRAAAEAKHLAKKHGTSAAAKQPEVQMPANEAAQAKAEAKHLKKKHGNVNDSADKRELAHPQH